MLRPWSLTLLALTLYLGWILVRHNGDPLSLVRAGDPAACTGYDGQFTYAIALNPAPAEVAPRLDVPAYRYQRILLPLLARALALGRAEWIVWAIPLLNVVAHVIAVALLEQLLMAQGLNRWLALVYGLWAGLVVSVRTDLAEPLAYGLVIAAYWFDRRGRWLGAALVFGLALFAKETTALFVLAQMLFAATSRDGKRFLSLLGFAVAPFVVWQLVLWRWFGAPGLGAGGCLATPFELIPFMGVWRIASVSLAAFGFFLLFLGPGVIFPAVWGVWASAREFLRGNRHPYVWALAVNALVIPFTPHSTFREPVGMLRFCCGLVLAVLLFAGVTEARRVRTYPWFWLAMLVFLIKD